eukprot:CAMPEP_0116043540 /NCGR_PEP_ID=MMETSP0321-20121206/26437_1 /TAXON_ID=163516 /ORGANISM="Leptocylindrus danicus var. danicus, Strain B650" /LENGTH=669 /DNA_ID=CAMNT_0003524409 /DNA_START=80 /DNA_END=2086 /DNA_ORIENTATION=-
MDEVNCYDGSTENAQATPSIRSDEANPSAATTEQQLVNAHVPVPVPVLPSINDLPIVTLPAAAEVATATATVAADRLLDDVHAKRRSVSHKYSLQNEKQWLDKLDELKKYCTEHGNCLVPQKYPLNPQLGTWVHKQRTQYANWKRDKPSQITAVRVKLLEEAGMDWSTVSVMQPKEEGWQAMYEKLVAFQQANGHCLVPKRYKPDSQLGEWVCNQRKHYGFLKKGKKTAITVERIKVLEAIGFVWDASSKCANQRDEARWLFMLEELKKYQTEKGDCLVPTKYAANPKLGNWVSNERRHYKLMLDKRPTSMTEERKRKLEEVGFSWLAPGSNYARHSNTTAASKVVASSDDVLLISSGGQLHTQQIQQTQTPDHHHTAKRICTGAPPSPSVAILEQHGINMNMNMDATVTNKAMADAASTATATAASVIAAAAAVQHPLSSVNMLTTSTSTMTEEDVAVHQALTGVSGVGLDHDNDHDDPVHVGHGITMAAIDPGVGVVAANNNPTTCSSEEVVVDQHQQDHDVDAELHEPVAVSDMQMQMQGVSTSAASTTVVVDGSTSASTNTSVAGVVAAIQATHSLDDADHATTETTTTATAEETANLAAVNVNMEDNTLITQPQPELEVSVEEVAARVAQADAAASKAVDNHHNKVLSNNNDNGEEDDAPLSLW